MPWRPRKILVEREVAGSAAADAVLSRFPDTPVVGVERIRDFDGPLSADDLAVARQRGRFIKKCPGTSVYTCCDYYILNLGIGCRIGCTYCYLHHYMNTPFTIYANIEELLEQARVFFGSRPRRRFRVGSGEFIDSLDFDSIADVHRLLIPALTSFENVTFEIKTKSDKVGGLLNAEHNGRAVISWSVNPESVSAGEEAAAPTLDGRLEAASKCVAAGYKVGFHFDPIIHFPGWEREYRATVARIFAAVPREKIAWISLGALRFNPALKPIIERDFPASKLTAGELVRGLDGKYRYFIAVRRKMFRLINAAIRELGPEVPVYLCMENKQLADSVGVSGLGPATELGS